jgi:ribosome-associated toxin RatA of RatAB toxin-antitoxin module
MPSAQRTIDIDAPPALVMGVITDFAAYPGFLSEIKEARVLRRGETGDQKEWEVAFVLSLIRELHYTLRLVQPSEDELTWSLVEGAFQGNDGSWRLEPQEDGRRTRAHYAISLQVGVFVPGSIVRGLVDRTLPHTLERFKSEAERRARQV